MALSRRFDQKKRFLARSFTLYSLIPTYLWRTRDLATFSRRPDGFVLTRTREIHTVFPRNLNSHQVIMLLNCVVKLMCITREQLLSNWKFILRVRRNWERIEDPGDKLQGNFVPWIRFAYQAIGPFNRSRKFHRNNEHVCKGNHRGFLNHPFARKC